MDPKRDLTAWSDADFAQLVQRVESGVREGRLAVLGGTHGRSELAGIGHSEAWLDEYADQIATLLDLGVFAFESGDDADIEEWAEFEPASDPEQAVRWVAQLRESAPSFGGEWTAHVSTFDRVIAAVAPQVTIDPERGRVVGQLVLHTVVSDGTSSDPISNGAEAITLTLSLTRNELLYLADRAQRAADMLMLVQDDARGDDE